MRRGFSDALLLETVRCSVYRPNCPEPFRSLLLVVWLLLYSLIFRLRRSQSRQLPALCLKGRPSVNGCLSLESFQTSSLLFSCVVYAFPAFVLRFFFLLFSQSSLRGLSPSVLLIASSSRSDERRREALLTPPLGSCFWRRAHKHAWVQPRWGLLPGARYRGEGKVWR